ncbi:tyrosine-type recombinase/integrase [Paraburkholderia aromaticivorans]|uniref:Integrase n=1 Tax=Paraburkholderia aromaticivorans TaxID=2026199 RepID=A0A248VZ32_9BURK|nr:tyrosine-type recombinase/integrase [Paraburkholderia aromaticivorans]ASW04135.1 integrase [Paraburkholderia aromaticivorans]
MRKSGSASFPALVQEFFTEYMTNQRALSPRTVASYRDSFALLLAFAEARLGKPPTTLQLADLDHRLIAEFLDHLEQERGNCVRSRNIRLAAIRSFLRFAARRDVTCIHLVEQALAVPMKRYERPMLGYLTREQMLAIIDVPATSWLGQRDRLLLAMLYNTGARVSEIVGIRVNDVVLGESSCVHLHGKGRKQRSVPLWKTTAREVRAWLRTNGEPSADAPLLPTRDGRHMTRANVAQRLHLAARDAMARGTDLQLDAVSPHAVRHSTAMHLLQSGVDIGVIALWLGHESPVTTHAYVEANLTMKEQALAKLEPPQFGRKRYRPPDALLRFLQDL